MKFQVVREGSSFIASFLEHPVCSNFQMQSVLVLVIFFQLATVNPKGIYKILCVFCFWNLRCSVKEAVLLLCSWSTLYIGFSKFKMSWFYFSYFNLPLLTESVYVKANFFWRFMCSAREAVLLPLSWRNRYVAISKCIMSWFQFFLFELAATNPKSFCKSHFFLKFYVFCERRSVIASFVKHPICSIFKM